MKTRDELQAMVDKLKTTWTAFGGLSKEEQGFLQENFRRVMLLDSNLMLNRMGGANSVMWYNCVYRLSPDFQLPPEDPKERWCLNLSTLLIMRGDNPQYMASDCIEITAEQKEYLETKPKAEDGFEWVLKVAERNSACLSLDGGAVVTVQYVCTRVLNGIRWVKVPVKVEPKKDKALHDVLLERARQEAIWGEQNHDPFTYLTILGEEYGETCKAALECKFSGKPVNEIRTEAVRTCAVALAIVECIDRGLWKWPEVTK